MVKKAVSRWLVATLEPSKSANVDFLDLVDKFNDHSNSVLAGLRISNGQLISFLEESFKGVKYDEASGRICGVNWRKPRKIEFAPIPTKDPEETEMECRLNAFLNDHDQDIKRGLKPFKTADFASYRQTWLMSGTFTVKHDAIDHGKAEEFLKRSGLVRWDEDSRSWFVKT